MAKTPLQPALWRPPPTPERARLRRGNRPWAGLRLIPVPGVGPEDVVIDPQGRLYTGLEDGRVLRVDATSGEVQVLADTGGRPLGLEVCPDGSLLVCDSVRGLLRLDPTARELEVLVSEAGGERLNFTSNVVRAEDGTVYFSSSTRRWGFHDWMADLLEHSGTGRLMRRDADGHVDVLLDGLQFTNGVALSADESCLFFAQTALYSVHRLWLRGPREGQVEPVLTNLPGFPDNMARGSDGLFWVALASPRNPMLDFLLPRPPLLRKAVHALPEWAKPAPVRTTWLIAFDEQGELVHDLQGPGDEFALATGVCEQDGTLYVGSLAGRALAVMPTPGG